MKKQSYYLLCLSFLLFIISLATLIKLCLDQQTILVKTITAGIVLLCTIVLVVNIIHLALLHQGVALEHKKLNMKKGQTALFIPLGDKDLDKINLENNIVELSYSKIPNEYAKLDVKQSRGLLYHKKLVISVDDEDECKILFSKEDVDKVRSSGLWTLFDLRDRHIVDFQIKSVTIKNNLLSVHYQCTKMPNKPGDLIPFLRFKTDYYPDHYNNDERYSDSSRVLNDVTLYEIVLKNLFRSCPMRLRNLLCMTYQEILTQDGEYDWFKAPEGKLALYFLKYFDNSQIPIQSDMLMNDEILHNKVHLMRCFVRQNNMYLTEDNEMWPNVVQKISAVYCGNNEGISSYCNLYKNYIVQNGQKLNELIKLDLKDEIYAAILTIASYNYFGDTLHVDKHVREKIDKTNVFIRQILNASEYKRVANDIDLLFPCKQTTTNQIKKKEMLCIDVFYKHLESILTKLGISNRLDSYHIRDLVYSAREYVIKHYIKDIELCCTYDRHLSVDVCDMLVHDRNLALSCAGPNIVAPLEDCYLTPEMKVAGLS